MYDVKDNAIAASIATSASERFPALGVVGVRIGDLDKVNRGAAVSALAEQARAQLESLDIDALSSHERVAVWRKAYRDMGLKPADFRSSLEQLLRRSLRGGLVSTDNWIVDVYNAASVAFLAPMGGYDLSVLGDKAIVIRALSPSDRFAPIGGDAAKFALTPNIVGYAAGDDVLCWALNHRDGVGFGLSPDTKDALFFSEAVDAEGYAASKRALAALADALAAAGASVGPVSAVGPNPN